MTRTKLIIIGAIAAAAALAVGTAAIAGQGGDDNELPITGATLEQASEAALAHTGEGRVTGTEIGDEESLYEVEVTLSDGSQVDVQLDQNFDVVGTTADDDTEPESESEDD